MGFHTVLQDLEILRILLPMIKRLHKGLITMNFNLINVYMNDIYFTWHQHAQAFIKL